jgi:hypothetical protein
MNPYNEKERSRLKRVLGWYNLTADFLWSGISLVPVCVFCYNLMDRDLLYIFIGVSLVPAFLPPAFLDRMRVGKTTATYKKLGVPLVSQLAHNGGIINRLVRRKFPHYKAVRYQAQSIKKLYSETYVHEKFHLILLVFFGLVTVYALGRGYWGWALIITVTNIVYNVYPSLLQQYIRLKLAGRPPATPPAPKGEHPPTGPSSMVNRQS